VKGHIDDEVEDAIRRDLERRVLGEDDSEDGDDEMEVDEDGANENDDEGRSGRNENTE
jgi:hypothetical protein